MNFGVHIEPFLFPPALQAPSIEVQAAVTSAEAAIRSADAAWATYTVTVVALVVTILTLIASGVAAYAAWKAVQGWRQQSLGQHEFGRLLDALQALHDLKATITNHRLPVLFEGEPDPVTKSKEFRSDLTRSWNLFLRATVGLDQLWGAGFRDLRDQAGTELRSVALASSMLYEQRTPTTECYLKMGRHQPDSRESIPEQRVKIDETGRQILVPFESLETWLIEQLRAYKPGRFSKA